MNRPTDSSVLLIIPARGGSRGIPFKNLMPVGGVSLIARAVKTACRAELVTDVVVSTDSAEIRAEAQKHGARVIARPENLSGDTASSEAAVLHALENCEYQPAVTVLLQCTSPFINPDHLDAAIQQVLDGAADVAFAATENHNFLWSLNDGVVTAVGHRADVRPRRQDREPQYRETGAFYAMRTEGFLAAQHRFFGKLSLQLVPESDALEIDTPDDLAMARAISAAAPAAPLDVDALITDFDGVHTDDSALVNAEGMEFVRVSRRDGMGVSRLRRTSVPLLILSTEVNQVVSARARKLRAEVLQAVDDKAAAVLQWLSACGVDPARAAYLGNDVNDLTAMGIVGWPVAVADAHPEVRAAARIVLHANGGDGAVREICERIIAANTAAQPTHSTQLLKMNQY